jgi:hypothetical protein
MEIKMSVYDLYKCLLGSISLNEKEDGWENPKGLWIVTKDGKVYNEDSDKIKDNEVFGKYKTEYRARSEAEKIKKAKK